MRCVYISPVTNGGHSTDIVRKTESVSGNTLCARCKRALAEQGGAVPDPATSTYSNQGNSHSTPGLTNVHGRELSSNPSDSNDDDANTGDFEAGDREQQIPQGSAPEDLNRLQAEFEQQRDSTQSASGVDFDYFATIDSSDKFDMLDDHQQLTIKSTYCPGPISMDLIFSEDLGPLIYKNILKTAPSITCRSIKLRRTNSVFSDHIDALEHWVGWSYSRWGISPILDDQYVFLLSSVLKNVQQ